MDAQSRMLQKTTKYSTIGFINLSKRASATSIVAGNGDESGARGDGSRMQENDPYNQDAVDQGLEMKASNFEIFVGQWIRSQLVDGGDGDGDSDDASESKTIGKICAIVPDQDGGKGTYCLEGKIAHRFPINCDDYKHSDVNIDAVGDTMESMGCVADTIVILEDGTNDTKDLHERMLRLMAGIKRRRGGIKSEGNYTGNIQVIAFVTSSNKGESLSYALTNMKEEMDSLQNRLEIEYGKDEGLQLVVHIVPSPRESLLSMSAVYRDWNLPAQSNSIPLLCFDRFIRGVITRLSGLKVDVIQTSFDLLFIGMKEKNTHKDDGIINYSNEDVNKSSDPHSLPTEALKRKLETISDELLSNSEKSISWLESKQDEILLDPDTKMPILEFGSDAERILLEASQYFDHEDLRALANGNADTDLIEGVRKQTLLRLAGTSGILRLFHTQLQSLREYYGRQYEAVLEKLDCQADVAHSSEDRPDEKKLRENENNIMAGAAEQFTEGFRTAAQNAIPLMCSEGLLEGFVAYTYLPVLDGLIKDMMHATSSREMIDDVWNDDYFSEDEGDDSDVGLADKKTHRPAKWYHKLAARIFVFGVNYLQGWLALQGIRKAAADRDKSMPKFPLF